MLDYAGTILSVLNAILDFQILGASLGRLRCLALSGVELSAEQGRNSSTDFYEKI